MDRAERLRLTSRRHTRRILRWALEVDLAAQKAQWDAHVVTSLAKNMCPYSGLEGPECKSWLCDCFDFEELWGVSQR